MSMVLLIAVVGLIGFGVWAVRYLAARKDRAPQYPQYPMGYPQAYPQQPGYPQPYPQQQAGYQYPPQQPGYPQQGQYPPYQ